MFIDSDVDNSLLMWIKHSARRVQSRAEFLSELHEKFNDYVYSIKKEETKKILAKQKTKMRRAISPGDFQKSSSALSESFSKKPSTTNKSKMVEDKKPLSTLSANFKSEETEKVQPGSKWNKN